VALRGVALHTPRDCVRRQTERPRPVDDNRRRERADFLDSALRWGVGTAELAETSILANRVSVITRV
jgi:hypothetical protein